MKRPRRNTATGPTIRLPHPDDYFTDSGLSWTFRPTTTTPAVDQAKPELEVWGWTTRMFDGRRKKVVIVCCALGALGFVPDDIAAEMWKAVEGAAGKFGTGFRATAGVCKLAGRVESREGENVTIRLTLTLHQRKGEPEAVVTPLLIEAWGIKRELLVKDA